MRQGSISGLSLRHALISGIERVRSRREELDRINVFPVADGDTGTNLAFTLGAVLDAVRDAPQPNAGLLLRRVADVALEGARGNSGTILAQFAQGMSESVGTSPRLDLASLARAASGGSRLAREALADPCEGTMLSVIAAFAAALEQAATDSALRVREGFGLALVRAREALARTPQQLAVLREAGVVDAGASGFVAMLEGMGTDWNRDPVPRFPRAGAAAPVRHEEFDHVPTVAHAFGDSRHRYCTECLVLGAALDRTAIKHALAQLELSSLVVAGNDTRVRVHAHVDVPADLFSACERFGSVSAHKADDMQVQAASRMSPGRVAVVMDSGADVPPELMDRHQLHVVPVRVSFGDRDFVDRVSLSPPEFYAMMRTGAHPPPRTSQPPPGDFRRMFEQLTSNGHDVAYIGLSRAVSGTLQAGEAAASRVRSSRNISVIDTRRASVAQGLMAVDAAECALTGAELAAVAERVDMMRARTRLFALIADPSYGVRGGRAPKLAEPLTRWLRVRLIVGMDAAGRMCLRSALVGHARLAERFGAWVARRCGDQARWRINIGHCDNPEGADAMARVLRARVRHLDACWIGEAGVGIGAHAGPGALIVGVQDYFAYASPAIDPAVGVAGAAHARTSAGLGA